MMLLSTKRVMAEIRSPSQGQHDQPVRAEHRRLRRPAGSTRRRAGRSPGSGSAGTASDPARYVMSRRKPAMAVVALVLQRDRRHREPGVVGEQRDHAVDVIGGERGGEPRREFPFPGRTGQRRALPVPGRAAGSSIVARARCSALFTEASLLSSMSATSDERKPSTSLSTQHGPLPRRQVLDGGRRRPARSSPWPHTAPPGRRRHPAARRAGHPGRAPATAVRPGGSARRSGTAARAVPAAAGGRWPAARSGTGWSRSGTARCAAMPVPRTGRARARRPAASPAARPRRPAPSRGSGSSAAEARPGTGR